MEPTESDFHRSSGSSGPSSNAPQHDKAKHFMEIRNQSGQHGPMSISDCFMIPKQDSTEDCLKDFMLFGIVSDLCQLATWQKSFGLELHTSSSALWERTMKVSCHNKARSFHGSLTKIFGMSALKGSISLDHEVTSRLLKALITSSWGHPKASFWTSENSSNHQMRPKTPKAWYSETDPRLGRPKSCVAKEMTWVWVNVVWTNGQWPNWTGLLNRSAK